MAIYRTTRAETAGIIGGREWAREEWREGRRGKNGGNLCRRPGRRLKKNGANKGGKKEKLAGKLCRRPGRRPTSRRLPPADAVVGGCLWPHHMSMCRRLGYVPSAQTGFVPTAKVCRRRPSGLVVLCRRLLCWADGERGCADGDRWHRFWPSAHRRVPVVFDQES
jgi:hypothetical protein